MTTKWRDRYARMSGLCESREGAPNRRFLRSSPGQSCPEYYPGSADPLGTPLSIRETAQIIGCSAWTVRQNYVPQGLPHLRSGPSGKLIFYRDQVVRWILERQTKGGTNQ